MNKILSFLTIYIYNEHKKINPSIEKGLLICFYWEIYSSSFCPINIK